MSYLAFHLVFILPPIVLLAASLHRDRARLPPRAGLSLALVALIALVYTTPWDNYLVWRGVWGYGEDRVLGTIGHVPVEEYLFFLLQPVLAGLWLYRVLGSRPAALGPPPSVASGSGEREGSGRVRAAGALAYLAVALLGVLALRYERGTYFGLILAWAAPVLAGQWAYAGGEIWRRRRAWALGVAVPTLYLWVVDAVAIRLGIWSISLEHSTGLLVLGLPVEEAAFFLVTTLLVVQGLMLFLFPPVPAVTTRRPPLSAGPAPTADDVS